MMATRSANKHSADSYEIAALAQRLGPEFTRVLSQHAAAIAEIEGTTRPEPDKLRKKDTDLIKLINDYIAELRQAFNGGDITRHEAALFAKIWLMFDQVERILWELKKEPGEPPDLPRPEPPEPPKPPKPGPRTSRQGGRRQG